MFHWVGLEDERSESSCPEAPFSVNAPDTVWVVPAVNVSVSAVATVFVRL